MVKVNNIYGYGYGYLWWLVNYLEGTYNFLMAMGFGDQFLFID